MTITYDAIAEKVLWQFDTPRFTVAYWAEPEDMAPEDWFELAEDIAAVRSGAVDWFCAFVGVFKDQECLGYDVLGGCAYESAGSFAEGLNRGGYFRDMVRAVLRSARHGAGLEMEGTTR